MPLALAAIFELSELCSQTSVADFGAGTGILTRYLAGRVAQVYAVEPNPEMRAFAESAQKPFLIGIKCMSGEIKFPLLSTTPGSA